jgi:hypothetical protein
MQASTPAPRPAGEDRGEAVSAFQPESPDVTPPPRREQGSRGSAMERVRGGLSSLRGGAKLAVADPKTAAGPSGPEAEPKPAWPFFAAFE